MAEDVQNIRGERSLGAQPTRRFGLGTLLLVMAYVSIVMAIWQYLADERAGIYLLITAYATLATVILSKGHALPAALLGGELAALALIFCDLGLGTIWASDGTVILVWTFLGAWLGAGIGAICHGFQRTGWLALGTLGGVFGIVALAPVFDFEWIFRAF